jgi:4-amino-4-deoxy-L-arabinose transferase-like glycosyltransferase
MVSACYHPRMTEAAREAGRPEGGARSPLERYEIAIVCGAVLLGLGLRLAHFFQIEANDPYFYFPSVDPRVYHEWATRIAAGDWLGDRVFFLSPLYPYALAVLYKIVGPSLYAARLVGLIAGAGSCALVYLVGKRTLGRATGAIAAYAWALYAPAIFYDGDLLVTAIQTPLNLLLALAIVRASARRTARSWALAGALLGLSALARPNVLLLGAILLPWMALALRGRLPWPRILLLAAAFAASTAALVLPATIRNYAVGRDLVLVSAQGGANFYIGNGPGATGVFRVPSDFPPTRADDPIQQEAAYRRVAEAASKRALKPSEVSDYWWRRTWSHIGDRPGRWLRLLGVKLGLFFNAYEPGSSGDIETSRAFSRVLRAPLLTFAAVSPLALLGMALAWRRRGADAFPLYAMVATYAASLAFFFVLSHYRMPVVPFLVVFAAYAVAWIAERIRARRAAALGLAAAGLLLAVAATQPALVDETGDRFIAHYNLGNKYRQSARFDEAIAEYEKSVALNPEYISAQYNLALLAERVPGHRDQSIAAWRRVLELGAETRDASYVEKARRHLARLSGSGGPHPAPAPPER